LLIGVALTPTIALADGGAQDAQTTSGPPALHEPPHQPEGEQRLTPPLLIEQHLAIGKTLLEQGYYAAAQARFRAILQLDATHPEALRLMVKAQQQLEAQQARAERAKAQLRRLAEDVAVKFAREKAKAKATQEARAREQVARAREQQLKFLYNRGLGFYRRDDFQAAIETFQQMVLLDPAHPLVRDAQRLMTHAETKQAEVRARAAARASPIPGPAIVSELEQQLAAKRIEVETVLKYAKIALKERNYEMALELLQRVLVQDPQNRQAQQLLQQAQSAKLKDEEDRLKRDVERDEQIMANDVLKAQILPETKPVQMLSPPPAGVTQQTMAAKLREPISLDFTDVALSDVLEFVADAANVSVIPSPQLDLKTRRVSLKVTELPLELALKYLAKNQSLAYRVEQDAILIATGEEFSNEPVQTRVFFLRKGLGPFALETAAVESNRTLAMESIKDLIAQTVPQPPDSKFVVDERSGALIVTNTGENLELVERLLSQLDVTPVQVLIEARFVELTMTELEQVGLESVLTGDYTLTKKKASGGGKGKGNVISRGGGFKFPDLSRQDEGVNLTLEGVLSALQFEAVLHALEETKKSKTLSAPRVTTLNNQTALIRVVEEFNYPTRYEVSLIQFDINGDGDFDDAGETEFANVPQDLQKRDIGILLNVTPSVGKDLKTITLVLAPEVSQFSQFRNLGGGVTVPEFTSSQLTTSVVIEDGQTVVLGGLMKDTTSEQLMKVPVLGDLPVVGALFRQKEETSTRKNLLIFITARLLAPRGQTT
jgi:type II secretory pathway component GspD/PulD (secretin)/outer membrane protein assembly factor BamD (BamD/ComL family)